MSGWDPDFAFRFRLTMEQAGAAIVAFTRVLEDALVQERHRRKAAEAAEAARRARREDEFQAWKARQLGHEPKPKHMA